MMTKYANSLKIMVAATAICCLVPLCHGAPTSFDIANGVLRGARGDAEEIIVPGGVKTVGTRNLQRQARRMRVLILSEGVECLERGGDWGYNPGDPLERVCIPASVQKIAPGTFYGFKNLKTLDVAKGSPFSVENGCLMDKRDGTVLYALPSSGTVVVPAGAKRICNYAFDGNNAVREVVLPNGVETIGKAAFSSCSALESINIPAATATIEEGAFSNCGKLSRIEVSPDNPRYCVRDGMLIDKKTATVVRAFGQLTHVEIPADVEKIGAGAFSSMRSITSVVVPDSVKRIEGRAFAFCRQLEKLRLPKRVDFCSGGIAEGCSSLKSIEFPAGMVSFSGQNLNSCDSLVELVIPEGVTSLDGWRLISCRNLRRLSLPASLRVTSGSSFGSIPKLEAIDIHPDNPSFHVVGGVLFSKDMTRLVRCLETKKGVCEIPQTVKRIDGNAFANCRLLTEIRIPAGATEIGYGAFENCTAKTKRVKFATSAKVEKPVFEIRDGAIRRMSLTEAEEIEIPKGVKTVGTRSIQRKAWYMRTLVLPEGVESLERGDDWRYNPGDPLEKVVIPASVRSIAPGAFYGFKNLATLDIAPGSPFLLAGGNLVDKRDGTLLYVLPVNRTVGVQDGVKRICDHAFAGNDSVREVVLPEGVVAIGKYAFSACSSLETIRIPASISEIGDGAFANCGKISQIEVSPDNPRYCVRDGMLMDKTTSTVVRAFGQPIRVEIPADVENIGEGAFSSMKSITFAVVPDSVRRIEKGAFSYCVQLEELLLPKRVEFCDGGIVQGCASLRAIEFPAGTARFSGQDLSHCDSLAELAPPEGVTTLRGWKTIDCGNLARLVLPASLKDTDGAAYGSIPKLGAIEVNSGNQSFRSEEGVLFNKDMTRLIRCPETKKGVYIVPETVKRIDGHAFANCSSLTDVRIPPGATNIGFGAFSDGPAKTNGVALAAAVQSPPPQPTPPAKASASAPVPETKGAVWRSENSLDAEEITVPGTARRIQYGSFNSSGKSRIKVIRLSEGVECIGESSFNNLTQLAKIVIPSTVTQIDSGAFRWVHSLKEIEIAPGAPFKLENGLLLDKDGKKLVFAMPWLERVTIPDSVTSVDDLAFVVSRKLQSIAVPRNHPTLSTDEHCLFGDSGKTLIKAFGSPVEIWIPNGVRRIAPEAFSQCETLRSAFVPDSVSDIGIWAFSRCVKLQTLRLPAKVDKCSPRIAESCTRLQRLVLPEGVEELVFSYSGLRSVTQLDFPKSLTRIGDQAIQRCEGLTEIVFPEGIREIRGGWVVSHCPNLVSIRLPATLEKVEGVGVFGDNPKLEAFEISPSNRFFKSVDGVLFDKDMTRLIQCPGAKSGVYEIPGTVTKIDPFAFSGCRNLTEIKIPASLKTIGDSVFRDCPAKRSHVGQ